MRCKIKAQSFSTRSHGRSSGDSAESKGVETDPHDGERQRPQRRSAGGNTGGIRHTEQAPPRRTMKRCGREKQWKTCS